MKSCYWLWALIFVCCHISSAEISPRESFKSLRSCLGLPSTNASRPSKRTILNFIRSNFAIIPLSRSPLPQHSGDSAVPRRVPRTLAPGGYCPYTIKIEDMPNRMPRFISYASCLEEICSPAICRPVMYSHQILVKKCGGVWTWSEKTLPVAFVPSF